MRPKAAFNAESTSSSRLDRPSSRVRAKLWPLIGSRLLPRHSSASWATTCWASSRLKLSSASMRAAAMEKLRWSKPMALTQPRP
ncbi:hypothetical protein D3C86_1906960 [compost metagenome]